MVTMALVGSTLFASPAPAEATQAVGVGPQYSSTHVYVSPEDFDRFVASFIATFGGSTSQRAMSTVTPMPSKTIFQAVSTPVGLLSVFGFTTPIPYPFGIERTGHLVTDMDQAVAAARASGADIVVAPFNDPIGRDAIIEWPGGVHMQLYWHTTAPSYGKLQSIPDNRVYLSTDKADEFIRDFVAFAHGTIAGDAAQAPGMEIGRPGDAYRRIRVDSLFGRTTVLVTDGHLPYPYGRELTGYEVADLSGALDKAKAAGATVLVAPYNSDHRRAAIVQFPGGYIAEIHSPGGD